MAYPGSFSFAQSEDLPLEGLSVFLDPGFAVEIVQQLRRNAVSWLRNLG